MAKPLEMKDRKIMQLIGECPNATILGLLPVETLNQTGILELVKTVANGSYHQLATLQRDFPAATSYAIALALSKGTTEANFYNALENELGVKFALNRRPELSIAFDEACRALGLVMPESEEETNTDRNIRPIIFQAGILHYWVSPLAEAVLSYLEKNPCPDLEDEQQVVPFARLLAERVPAAQARLRRTLESSVGPIVCRAILSAFSSRDFDQLPPHLREPMREARRKTGGESIRSPYLRYKPEDGLLQVVLPKQSSKLADFNSCWVLGKNTYNALIECTLAVEDLSGTKCQICLTGLRNQFRDQVFSVKLTPDEQEPFFVFRGVDGRRMQLGLRPIIELPLGDYHIVLPAENETNEEEAFGPHGKFKAGKVEIFPGRDDLEIRVGGNTVRLRPKLGSDLIIHDKAGNKLQAVEGTVLFYGDELEIQAYTPAGSGEDSEKMEFKIECVENPEVASKKCSSEKANTKGAYYFYDLSADLVRPFLSKLAAGIHEVQVTAEGRARSFSRSFCYWKGFRRTTKNFGFVCDELPHNFDATTSIGIRKADKGLQICEDHRTAEVVIGIKRPQKTFTLAKPGIWLRLVDPERLDSRPVAIGKSIDVNSNEQLVLESGDTLPWKIYCDQTVLAELKPGQAKQTLNLGALLSQFGESLALEAKNPSGQTQQLVSFAKANLARQLEIESLGHSPFFHQAQGMFAAHKNLKVEEGTFDNNYRASFRIGRSQIQQLEVHISNFSEINSEVSLHKIEIAEGEFALKVKSLELAKITIKADGCDWLVKFEANPTVLPPGVYFIDFKTKKEGQPRWQQLKVADKHGLSESRIVVCAKPECANATDAWGRTLILAASKQDLDEEYQAEQVTALIPEKEVGHALKRLQEALLFKYASPVWPHVQWLETALVRTCRDSYQIANDTVTEAFATVAVASLAQKARASLSIHSTLIFGSQPLLLSLAGARYSTGEIESQVGQVFKEIGKLAAVQTLKDYAATNFSKGCAHEKLLKWFGNFAAVAMNNAKEFKDFDYRQYFEYLANESQELDFKQAEVNFDALLTAEHFLAAVTALNRRFRPLEKARNNNETGAALDKLNQEIQACGNRLDQVSPTVKSLVGFPNYLDLSIPIGIAESALVQVVSDLLLTITGLARLAASGLLKRSQYLKALESLLAPEQASLAHKTHRMCLLISLAPELFAYYMLFWEATLKPIAKYERN